MAEDFYIEAECCLSCGVPESIAPELFGMGKEACFLRRQPVSRPEIDKMVEAMWSSEVDCIRYRGNDIAFLKRLGKAGMSDLADDSRARDFPAVGRDRVIFPLPANYSPAALAARFRDFLARHDRYSVRRPVLRPRRVSFSWYEGNFHSVVFDQRPDGHAIAMLYPKRTALKGLARIVDGWLRESFGDAGIAWHTEAGLAAGEEGFRLPF